MSQNNENDQTEEEELLSSSQKTIEDLLTDEELLLSSQSQESGAISYSQGTVNSHDLASQCLDTTCTQSSQGSEILDSVDSQFTKSNDDEKSTQWDSSACTWLKTALFRATIKPEF